jgi:hypothetical protein
MHNTALKNEKGGMVMGKGSKGEKSSLLFLIPKGQIFTPKQNGKLT